MMLSEVGRTGVWYLCRLIYGEPRGVLKAVLGSRGCTVAAIPRTRS